MAANTLFMPKPNQLPSLALAHSESFLDIVENFLNPSSKICLAQTSTAIHNVVCAKFVHWRSDKFCYQEFCNDDQGVKRSFKPVEDSKQAMILYEQPSWTVVLKGSWMGYLDKQSKADGVAKRCKRETVTMLYHLSNIVESAKVHELVFIAADMLSAELIMAMKKPFKNLRRIQFHRCRELTMQVAAQCMNEEPPSSDHDVKVRVQFIDEARSRELGGLATYFEDGGTMDGPPPPRRALEPLTTRFEYIYTTEIDDSLSTLRGENCPGSVLASLYMWREIRP